MNKKIFPATAVALALSISVVAAPQAVAEDSASDNESGSQSGSLESAISLEPGKSKRLWLSTFFGDINVIDPGHHDQVESISFTIGGEPVDWLEYEVDSSSEELIRKLSATSAAPKGEHILDVAVAYNPEFEQKPVEGKFHVTITGADTDITGSPKAAVAKDELQDTGISIANRTHGINPTKITAIDKAGDDVDVSFGTPSDGKEAILVNPGAEAVSPITLTISDSDLEKEVSETIRVTPAPITTTLAGSADTVEATDKAQETGLTVTNRVEGKAEITAVDEDGQPVGVTFGEADEDGKETILVKPGENVDGPITLTFDHPALDEPWTEEIRVKDHSENKDDNDFDPIVVSGTPHTVKPTDDAQDTGLRIANQTKDTAITATDEDGAELDITVEDGKILVTPGTEVDGPIQLVINDDTMAAAKEFTIEVEGHEADRDDNDAEPTTPPTPGEPTDEEPGSSLGSSDDSGDTNEDEDGGIDWAVIGIVGVIAAVIGVLVAIGGGFLPLL